MFTKTYSIIFVQNELPLYHIDLSQCDFWLFDLIRRNRTDRSDSESLHNAKDDYRKALDKSVERIGLYDDNQGHYFEQLMK